MAKENDFEKLKAEIVESLTEYILIIQDTAYEDLKNFHKRMPLLQHYIDNVEINTAFRAFILNELQKPMLEHSKM